MQRPDDTRQSSQTWRQRLRFLQHDKRVRLASDVKPLTRTLTRRSLSLYQSALTQVADLETGNPDFTAPARVRLSADVIVTGRRLFACTNLAVLAQAAPALLPDLVAAISAHVPTGLASARACDLIVAGQRRCAAPIARLLTDYVVADVTKHLTPVEVRLAFVFKRFLLMLTSTDETVPPASASIWPTACCAHSL